MTEIQLIEEMLLETAEILHDKYAGRSRLEVISKNDSNDFLTEANRAVQDIIC